jgi:hypothetical protein
MADTKAMEIGDGAPQAPKDDKDATLNEGGIRRSPGLHRLHNNDAATASITWCAPS